MSIIHLCADLGSNFITIGDKSNGINISEVSVVAVDNQKRIVAFGTNAMRLKQLHPDAVTLVYPFREGLIDNFPTAVAIVQNVLERLIHSGLFRPSIHVTCCVACGLSSEDKKAYESLFIELQVKKITFIESPTAVYQLASHSHLAKSCLVAVIGSTVTDIAAFDNGELLCACSIFWAGDALSNSISDYISKEYSLAIDAEITEKIKHSCASMYENDLTSLTIKGTHTSLGVIQSCTVTAKELYKVCVAVMEKIFYGLSSIINSLDQSDAADVLEGGLYIGGGTALLSGIDKYFIDKLGIDTTILADPNNACLNGMRLLPENKK